MIKLKGHLIDFYGNPAGYIKNSSATVDSNFECEELKQWLYDNSFEPSFKDGVFEKLALNRKYYEAEDAKPIKSVKIWQLKSTESCRFVSFAEMLEEKGNPTKEAYNKVFEGELHTNDLEQIYEICNTNHPQGYDGHSLSMSDVIELFDEQESEFFYVDKFGFKQINFEIDTQILEQNQQIQQIM